MSLKIIETYNSSDPEKEYIVLKALSNIDLKGYAVTDKTFKDGGSKISNKFRHIYEFSSKKINKDEIVLLYTGHGKGKNKESYTNVDKQVLHPIFWKSDDPIWNDTGDTAILIRFDVISELAVAPVTK